MYKWGSQKGGSHLKGIEAARDHADRDQEGGEVAQVPVRPARGFALLDFDPHDLCSGHDAVGFGPVAIALVWRHFVGVPARLQLRCLSLRSRTEPRGTTLPAEP